MKYVLRKWHHHSMPLIFFSVVVLNSKKVNYVLKHKLPPTDMHLFCVKVNLGVTSMGFNPCGISIIWIWGFLHGKKPIQGCFHWIFFSSGAVNHLSVDLLFLHVSQQHHPAKRDGQQPPSHSMGLASKEVGIGSWASAGTLDWSSSLNTYLQKGNPWWISFFTEFGIRRGLNGETWNGFPVDI